METVILFRQTLAEEDEYRAAIAHFDTFEYRSSIPEYANVIGRYSVLPYYEELTKELNIHGSSLINSFEEHSYIADVLQYYEDIKEFTPKTYSTWAHITEGKWVIKGRTNSRKHQWNTHMYAEGRENVLKVVGRLYDDTMVREQGLVIREYVPLNTVDIGINGLPITKEWRCFYYKDQLIAQDYYWSSHPECYQGKAPAAALELTDHVAKIISKKATFFVLDVAEKVDGGYVIVEVNDGQMSGLSCISPEELYKNLKDFIC